MLTATAAGWMRGIFHSRNVCSVRRCLSDLRPAAPGKVL